MREQRPSLSLPVIMESSEEKLEKEELRIYKDICLLNKEIDFHTSKITSANKRISNLLVDREMITDVIAQRKKNIGNLENFPVIKQLKEGEPLQSSKTKSPENLPTEWSKEDLDYFNSLMNGPDSGTFTDRRWSDLTCTFPEPQKGPPLMFGGTMDNLVQVSPEELMKNAPKVILKTQGPSGGMDIS